MYCGFLKTKKSFTNQTKGKCWLGLTGSTACKREVKTTSLSLMFLIWRARSPDERYPGLGPVYGKGGVSKKPIKLPMFRGFW